MPWRLLTDSTHKLFELLQTPWLWPTCTRFAVSWMSGIRSANPSSCSNSSWYLVGSRDFPFPFDLLILKTRFCNVKPEILSCIEENSGLLGCDAVSLGEWLPLFWRTVVPSSSRVKQSKWNRWTAGPRIWSQCNPSECQNPLTWHGITSQKTGTLKTSTF